MNDEELKEFYKNELSYPISKTETIRRTKHKGTIVLFKETILEDGSVERNYASSNPGVVIRGLLKALRMQSNKIKGYEAQLYELRGRCKDNNVQWKDLEVKYGKEVRNENKRIREDNIEEEIGE